VSTPLRRHRADDAERRARHAQGLAAAALSETVRLRRALDALTLAILVYDEDGALVLHNRQHGELEANRQVAALVTAAVDRLVGEARGGRTATETLVLHGPPPRTLTITAVPLESDGQPVGTIAVIEDISERRRLEAVRRDFAANVSHELRTPIGALAVLAEALAVEDDPVVTRRLVNHITAEAERAGRLIEDLLDLSRIEAEGIVTHDLVDTNAVTDAAAERVLPLAAQRDVTVVVSRAEPAPRVRGDERQLVSAVANLLDNAVKYSEPGSKVEVGSSRAGGWACIGVRDQGIGIPAKDLERIFERFYRVDRARSRETGGTGLGLSIVRHVATNHGGDVLVSSREGEGSTFTLRLPPAEPAEAT
jgi:two-component system, OmpR family, sensor histidine kinase SenX3